MKIDNNKLKERLIEIGDRKIGSDEIMTLLNSCRDLNDDKYIRDGKYAVLVSGGYGAGFSTWCDIKAHDPRLISFLYENGLVSKANKLNVIDGQIVDDFIRKEIVSEGQYLSGLWDCHIEWIDLEDDYRIDEYDGFETLVVM